MVEPGPARWEHVLIKSTVDDSLTSYASQTGASGLAAVWATGNTRAAGGFDFVEDDVYRSDFATYGYANGVPMGGDMRRASGDEAPSFVVRALRDPDGANLDRIQMVKGWMDSSGTTHEMVYDITLSDDRVVGPDGKAPPVGDTVDVANASFKNTIGDGLLFVHWTDPAFDSKENAFYYVRVIEIPTPRWTAYDAKIFGIDMPDEIPMKLQGASLHIADLVHAIGRMGAWSVPGIKLTVAEAAANAGFRPTAVIQQSEGMRAG